MSFYGNISNISRTQFRFERTYANRKIMDESAAMDGVYVGNYVLVDYDTELAADWGVPCYAYPHVNGNYYEPYAARQITAENFNIKVNNGQCFILDTEENKFVVPELDTFDAEETYYQYMDIDPEPNGAVELWTAERGTLGAHRITYAESIVSHITYPTASATKTYFKYFLVKGNQLTTDLNGVNTLTVFNHLNGDDGNLKDTLFEVYSFVQTSNNQNEWYPIVRAISEDNHVYARNFTIDSLYYDNARGYDSTVWQKTYSGNPATARYVMIAELNSVVPSFSVSGDAPTLSPTVPHFSTESNNFHYKLHMQAPWGMRVKSAINVYGQEYTTGSAGERVRLNFEPIIKKALPSDENVVWTRPFYNEDLGTIDTYTFTWNETSADKLTIAGIWDTTVSTNSSVPGAIYYNKAGFNPNISVHNYLVSDHITVEPSGLSGQKYNTHGAIYTALNPITSEVAFGLAVAQREKYCQDNYAQQQIMVSGSNPEKFYDLYGRDKLYKIQNNKYVVAEYYDNNVEQYYYKSTNVAPNSSAPDVDTQEIAIMLPSIGNSIADMWDLIYGDSILNGDNYRNTQLDWINGSTYYRGSGLRLLSFVDEGIEYNVEAVNTLAGSINTAHDLLGMLIRKRPDGITAIGENNLLTNGQWDNDKINNLKTLSNAYVYYYPDEYKYYRLGTTYEWDMTGDPVTTYDAANKNSARYLVEVETDENHGIAVWPEPNTGLFYIEECEGWEKGAGVKQYNYVLEQKYTKGIKYYTIDTTDCTLVETVMNAFHPEDYYEHDDEFSLTYIENEVEKTKTISAFVKTKDEVANPSTHYFKLGDEANNVPAYQLLGDEYRFFECDENDTERQYYVLASEYYVDDGTHPDDPNWELAQETHLNDLNQEIVENISENTYNARPSKYFIRNAENKYVNTEAYLSNTEYYTPVRFNLVASLQEFLQYQAEGRRFYSVDAKRSADRKIWLQTTTYVRQDDINNTNFSRYVLYTKTENGYIVALTYDENETYYTKNVSFILTQEVPIISADNATEFKLLDPNETNDYGYSKYYYYNPVGTSGYPEYYAVTSELANRLELPIVTVNATENTGFFVPGVYYYKVETGEYAGSWLLETSKLPKQGRQYYMNGFGIRANEAPEKSDKITLQNFSYYSSDEFYDAPDDLNQNTIFISDDGRKYYKYSPLFVYNDPTGTFKQGEKWNMNVSLTPRDADENNCIQLRQYKEIPQMIELHNFGRNTHTLVGGLRRLDEYLSINDTKTRSRKTVQGVLNNLLDIVDVFKDISPNELLISNQYGQIYSRGIVLNNVNDNNIIAHSAIDAADPWVHLTENRVDDQGNWHIQVHHKLLNDNNGTLQPVTNTDLVINAAEDAQAQTPLFGETFNILNRVKKDAAGHLHSITTDTVKIPLPSLNVDDNLNTSNDYLVLTDVALDATNGAFTYRRHNVADLKLHDYSNTDSSTNPVDNTATKLVLSSDNSINTAFAAIESYIWNSDVQDVFVPTASDNANKLDNGVTTANVANWYITNLTETDGRINYSLTRLINTSNDIVLRSTDAIKGQTAVSAHAVREAINDLDIADKCAPNAALAANKLDNNINSGNIANWYITGLSETDGLIDYSFTRLINTSSDIVLRSSDNVKGQTAVSAHAVREAINDLDSQYSITVADGEYVTGIQITDGLIDTTTTGTVTGKNTFESSITRTSTSKVAPQSAAVATYLDSVLNAMETTNSANTSSYITSLTQDTNGKIAYSLTSLLTTVADGYGANAGYAASGTMVRASIDDIFATTQTISAGDFISSWSYTANAEGYKRFAVGTISFITNISTNTDSVIAPTTGAVVTYVTNLINELDASASVTNTSTAAKFITGITQTNGTIASISDTPFIDTIVGNETGDNSIIAPTTAAVVNYLSNYTGTTNVTTLGTISEGTWQGTAITDDYINSVGADKIIISQEDLTNMIADLETTPTPESTDITDDDDSTLLAILRKMYHRIKTLEDNA